MRRVVCRMRAPILRTRRRKVSISSFVPGSPVQIVAQAHEHLVSQCMQEESKLIGQESMTAESVHAQMILEGLDEVLGLPSVCIVVIK